MQESFRYATPRKLHSIVHIFPDPSSDGLGERMYGTANLALRLPWFPNLHTARHPTPAPSIPPPPRRHICHRHPPGSHDSQCLVRPSGKLTAAQESGIASNIIPSSGWRQAFLATRSLCDSTCQVPPYGKRQASESCVPSTRCNTNVDGEVASFVEVTTGTIR